MGPVEEKRFNLTRGASEAKLNALDLETHYQDRIEALFALIKTSTAIGFMRMEPKASLKFLVEETKKVFDAYGCAIFSLNGSIEFDLICSGQSGLGKQLYKPCKINECVVIRDELPFIIKDTKRKDKRCNGFELDRKVKSYACLPISTGKKLVGILTISSLRKQAFTQEHLEMMLSVATMAGSVIQQAQLFHKLKKEKRRLERAYGKINKLNVDLEVKIEDLQEAQNQIIQTEKLAVAGRLAAGVAHEINNPIGIIINRIECIQSEAQEKGVSNDLIKDLCTIGKYAHRISKIVEDLSIFSRTTYSEPDFTRIDINDVLTDVFFLVEQKIKGKKIRLIKKLYPESLFVLADSDRLEQVFINIIENAIHAISGKGSITVSTRAEKKCIQTEISDSGIGMPEEQLNKIYDPFFTTKEVGKGTGLGLPISQAIVADHNASISVDSRINKGTTFTITFPKTAEFNNK
ncbi:MAG: GAF domain-containing protein [Deltaproteobacteria bacterium]|nr:GAF domain-containing protein [Deltaproteobacteria bacterium]